MVLKMGQYKFLIWLIMFSSIPRGHVGTSLPYKISAMYRREHFLLKKKIREVFFWPHILIPDPKYLSFWIMPKNKWTARWKSMTPYNEYEARSTSHEFCFNIAKTRPLSSDLNPSSYYSLTTATRGHHTVQQLCAMFSIPVSMTNCGKKKTDLKVLGCQFTYTRIICSAYRLFMVPFHVFFSSFFFHCFFIRPCS